MTGLVLILAALLSPFTVAGQTQQYTVATGQYVLDLPSAQWRPITASGTDYPCYRLRAQSYAEICGNSE